VTAPTIEADIAVVGGGLGGMPLAIACARAGIRTVVIDRERPPDMLEEPFDGRTTAIAFGSRRVLEGIGVWPHVGHAEPILDIRVTDAGSSLFLHYDHRAVGDEPLGWIVENRDLRRALLAAAAEPADLLHLAPATVAGFERDGERVVASLADGRRVRARLLVGADGKNSEVRRWAGIPVLRLPYPQHSIICTVEHERPHGGVAVENFLPSGPFAILPLAGSRSSIVWTEQAELAERFLALDEPAFTAEVAARFGDWLGPLRVIGQRAFYKLELMIARRMAAPRAALVADAAHVIHPIAGQGLNLGIRDVAALAELVVDQCRLGLDPGATAMLDRYERWRRVDTLTLAATTDALNRLFSNEVAPVKLVRELGLGLVERIPPLKRLFMQHAMGLVGTLPRLVAGGAL